MDPMTRSEAIALVDQVHRQYIEALRTGICPVCEATIKVEEVDRAEVPPAREQIIRRTEEYLEQKSDRIVHWSFEHLPDCRFVYYWKNLPVFCRRMNIRVEHLEVAIPRGEGSWTETVDRRVPDEGDPPVA
jgi:hypothetical protein